MLAPIDESARLIFQKNQALAQSIRAQVAIEFIAPGFHHKPVFARRIREYPVTASVSKHNNIAKFLFCIYIKHKSDKSNKVNNYA